MNLDPLVYLNGQYIERSKATISVLDRGFLFADGVYEVIPIYEGKALGQDEHLTRLDASLKATQIELTMSIEEWNAIFQKLLAQYPDDASKNYAIYLQVTRGAAPERAHAFPNPVVAPTVFVQITPLSIMSPEKIQQGLTATLLNDIRWDWCYIKSVSLLPNILLQQQAKQQGYDEAILVRDGHISEGTSSNVFIVKDNVILTPKEEGQILGGITRNLVLQLAKQHGLSYEECTITPDILTKADEVWITSASKDVAPIVKIDEHLIGGGNPGPLWKTMYQHFQDYKHHS